MDVNSGHSLLVTNNFFPNFLKLPLEIQSRIIFLSVVTNLPKQSNSNKGAFSAKSPLVKNFTKTAKALHLAIDNVFCYTIKLEYIDKHSFNIKFALYKSLENKDKIDTRIFTKTELEHLSKDECSLLYPKILKEDNVEAFNSLLNNKNFTPDLYAYYWLLALNKLKEADVLLNKIQNTEEDLNISENEYSDFTPKKFKEINDFISKKEKEKLDIGEMHVVMASRLINSK
ncbi:hypothetical protein BN1013_02127 [Candidatus Rubidus massiliensis]|nr:hypothetical protein BN1013_02127 [Candidatus Rubidus massiliensis]